MGDRKDESLRYYTPPSPFGVDLNEGFEEAVFKVETDEGLDGLLES